MSNKNNTPNIDALHYDAHNFNAHTEQGRALLKKSVTENGFGRSIVVDRDNNIIAGNGVVEAAKSLNKKSIRIIDTTGDELVVVRRTDLDIDSEEGRRLALADNATSAVNLAWNYDELEKAREVWNVKPEDWGVDMKVSEDNSDSRNITATERLSDLAFNDIYYTPSEIPDIKLRDCVNLDKYNAKMDAIREMNLTDEQVKILTLFAYRFIKIDFEMVANYYAFNATDEERKAMERLRLVLVDGSLDGFINDELLRIANEQAIK